MKVCAVVLAGMGDQQMFLIPEFAGELINSGKDFTLTEEQVLTLEPFLNEDELENLVQGSSELLKPQKFRGSSTDNDIALHFCGLTRQYDTIREIFIDVKKKGWDFVNEWHGSIY